LFIEVGGLRVARFACGINGASIISERAFNCCLVATRSAKEGTHRGNFGLQCRRRVALLLYKSKHGGLRGFSFANLIERAAQLLFTHLRLHLLALLGRHLAEVAATETALPATHSGLSATVLGATLSERKTGRCQRRSQHEPTRDLNFHGLFPLQ